MTAYECALQIVEKLQANIVNNVRHNDDCVEHTIDMNIHVDDNIFDVRIEVIKFS